MGTTAPLKIETETSTEDSPDSGTVLGSIHLPPALFLALSEELTEVGVWFSLHKRGSFFPLPDDATVNDSVSTPVISATVGGHAMHGLLEPVLFSLQLLNRVSYTYIRVAVDCELLHNHCKVVYMQALHIHVLYIKCLWFFTLQYFL